MAVCLVAVRAVMTESERVAMMAVMMETWMAAGKVSLWVDWWVDGQVGETAVSSAGS
jgi:hypothetical protein